MIPAAVLYARQSDDALLQVNSFPGAVLEVAFWAVPSFVLYAIFVARVS